MITINLSCNVKQLYSGWHNSIIPGRENYDEYIWLILPMKIGLNLESYLVMISSDDVGMNFD